LDVNIIRGERSEEEKQAEEEIQLKHGWSESWKERGGKGEEKKSWDGEKGGRQEEKKSCEGGKGGRREEKESWEGVKGGRGEEKKSSEQNEREEKRGGSELSLQNGRREEKESGRGEEKKSSPQNRKDADKVGVPWDSDGCCSGAAFKESPNKREGWSPRKRTLIIKNLVKPRQRTKSL